VGAVIVKAYNIIATGYNGSPSGHRHCNEEGNCYRTLRGIPSGEGLHLCRASHAEINAITQAAKHGNATDGATMYLTTQPCGECAKAIVGAGIKRVVFRDSYPNSESAVIFALSHVVLERVGERG
jgi:dCMP deaminase